MKKELLDNSQVKPFLAPTESPLGAGTTTTLWLPKGTFKSLVIALSVGIATGTITAQSVKITVQDATDASGTGAANLTDIFGNDIEIELTADSVNSDIDVDLEGARDYIGASIVVGFTATAAAAATGALTFSSTVSDGELVTIGNQIYEFDTDGAVTAGHILVDVSGGATAAAAVTALVAAITGATSEYTAVDGTGDVVDVTYGTTGTAGNAIATTTDCANGTWGAATLEDGVDTPVIPVNIFGAFGDPRDTREIS